MTERTRTERIVWSKKTGKAFDHGTFNGYDRHGCGCDACWQAYSSSRKYERKREIQRAANR